MSSNPVLDDDDILLIPADEEPASNDTPTSSSISPGSIYPHWTEDPNRLPTSLNIPETDMEMEMRRAKHPAQLTVIQISGGQSGRSPPLLADPLLSTTAIEENQANEGNITPANTCRKRSLVKSGICIFLGIVAHVIFIFVIKGYLLS